VPLVVLLTVAGDQVPLIPFSDVPGKTGAAEPLQNGGIGVKVGTVETILKFRQAGNATLPHRSVTEFATFVRQTWNAPFVVMAGLNVSVILLP
jgi:hypothetical protein